MRALLIIGRKMLQRWLSNPTTAVYVEVGRAYILFPITERDFVKLRFKDAINFFKGSLR